MAKAEVTIIEAKPEKKPEPRITFVDEAIDKYLPDGVEDMNIGDTVELAVKGKIVSLEKRKTTEYDRKGEKEKEVTRRYVEIELVSGPDKGFEALKRKLGRSAASTLRMQEKKR